MYFGAAKVLGEGGGLSVSHERIAEIIRDLDPTLELAYIPDAQRSSFDRHPFAIIHRPTNGAPPYIAITMPENEVDERLIAKLIKRDTHRGSVIDEMEAHEAAQNLLRAKNKMDEQEEIAEFAQSFLKSKKHTYRHNGKVYQ